MGSLPRVGDDPAEPSATGGCVVCGTELAMITVAYSDENDEELPDVHHTCGVRDIL